MRTSLNDIKQAEDLLMGRLEPAGALLLKAKLLLDPALRSNMVWLRKTLDLVKLYSRQQVRSEVDAIHNHYFSAEGKKAYRESIEQLFSKP
jgi:hypothetical protein